MEELQLVRVDVFFYESVETSNGSGDQRKVQKMTTKGGLMQA